MLDGDPTAVVTQLGVLVQLSGELLLVGLFMLLRRFVLRRSYFTAWTVAWASGAVAIGAVAVRHLAFSGPATETAWVVALDLLYQGGKLASLGLFVVGTTIYVTGQRLTGSRRALIAFGVLYTIASLVGARNDLVQLVVWQAPVAVVALGACAGLLFSLPESRRTLGSVASATAFAALAVLWLLYGIAFSATGHATLGAAARGIVTVNSYFDLMLNTALGFAMVVLLMEDAKREVDDAQAELRVAHDQLQRAAMYDTLTDSLNRRAFAQRVGLEMARATFGTVVIADVDNLKVVNDVHGHAAGDRIIRQCADLLRGALRPYDRLFRWGGDEFLLVIPSARAADVRVRLEEVLARAEPLDLGGGKRAQLLVSLGAADYASAEELESAIQAADSAMYRNKQERKSPAAGMRAVNIPSAAISIVR